MEIPGYNYFIMFACADTHLSYIGNNMVDVNGNGQPPVQVSNLPKAYDEALQQSPDLTSLSRSVREKVYGMRQAPLTPQIVQTVESLMPAQGGAFGFWSQIASWMWGNLVRPVAQAGLHAGLNAVQQVANNAVEGAHRAVDTFAFAPASYALPDGLYVIKVFSGTTNYDQNKFLATADDGSVRLHGKVHNLSQVWAVSSTELFSTIEVAGGPEDKIYLGSTTNGDKVILHSDDDASGRQRWKLQPNSNGSWRIEIVGGVTGDKKYLSCPPTGERCNLWPRDDESGRQQWILEPLGGMF